MSDLDLIPLPARVVRATFKASQAKERAELLGRSAWDRGFTALLMATLGLTDIATGDVVFGCVFLGLGLAQAAIAITTYVDHRKAKRRHTDLTAITDHYALTRTVLPWPKEDT